MGHFTQKGKIVEKFIPNVHYIHAKFLEESNEYLLDDNITKLPKRLFERLFLKSTGLSFAEAMVLQNIRHAMCRAGWADSDCNKVVSDYQGGRVMHRALWIDKRGNCLYYRDLTDKDKQATDWMIKP